MRNYKNCEIRNSNATGASNYYIIMLKCSIFVKFGNTK